MARQDVFISYARSDGEPFANELSQRLQSEFGISVWQDRISMAPGDFEQQIRQAIELARYLVVVVTPGALRSGWVEKEWRQARQNGICICPFKPSFSSPSTELEYRELRAKWPRWMQQINTWDFEGYWKEFVNVLQSPCQATRTPFLARSLPPNFVKRPLEAARIIDGLLDNGRANPSGKMVALYGSGGFGKTSLALSVGHDEDVLAACDGGVLWATLGKEPRVIDELTAMHAALTGERPRFTTVDDAIVAVSEKLVGKRCLMIIDDVWEDEHLRPFLESSRDCSRLFTTRRFDLAVHQVDDPSRRINVAELKSDEALAVLTQRITPSPASLPRFRQLAARLGEWPMLLQLVNATLLVRLARPGVSIEDALDWADAEYDSNGVGAFDSIAKSVESSLSLLKENRAHCLELAIFPEDTDIPLEWIGVLWQAAGNVTQTWAEQMANLALIELDLSRKTGPASRGSVRLHDVMRSYFAAQLGNAAASLHARLADAWKDPRRIAGEYARQYAAYHVAEAMADPGRAMERGRQFLDLLTDARYREYRDRHGDPAALHREIRSAVERAARSNDPDAPPLVAALTMLQKSYAISKHNPQPIFEAALAGQVQDAVLRLDLLDAEPEWNTLARLLIAWLAAPSNSAEASELADTTSASCDQPELQTLLAWVRTAPGLIPPGLAPITLMPDPYYISATLQRAGGAETVQGMEPIDLNAHASGITKDASAFIADQDGPLLVAFARLDPPSNSESLERYIEIHASNRYRYYRNRSLWALLKWVLAYPDADWVRNIVQKIVAAALTVTQIDFEEFLPLAVLGHEARFGDQAAAGKLEAFRQRLFQEAAAMGPGGGTPAPPTSAPPSGIAPSTFQNQQGDSWSHYQRRACALAEVYALALDRPADAAGLLQLARNLPKGFAGFRAFSALTLAESSEVILPGDRPAIDAALESALAASHRIQDYPFCLRATAIVNAMRMNWWNPIPALGKLEPFLKEPLGEDFCAIHRVLEDFHYRYSDSMFQSLPMPESVLNARTLDQIAEAYRRKPDVLAAVNRFFEPEDQLSAGDLVNIPEPDFVPVLAARFAAAVLVAPGLTDERRSALIQRLGPLAIPNRTALDTVLARLLLSARNHQFEMPKLLAALDLPAPAGRATGSESMIA
jgi:TIR domain/NB-ARC domain